MVTFDFAIYTGGLEEAHPNIEVGRLIHATKAHRNADLKQKHGMVGDRGPYRCLSCNEPVNRSGGYNIQDAHFRHYHDSACNGGSQETARHILMKEGIGQLLNLQPNITAEVEKRLPGDSGKQPDVTVTFDSGEQFFVEVVVEHPPEPSAVEIYGRRLLVVSAKHCDLADLHERMLAPALFVEKFLMYHNAEVALSERKINLDLLSFRPWKTGPRKVSSQNVAHPRFLDDLMFESYFWVDQEEATETVRYHKVAEMPVSRIDEPTYKIVENWLIDEGIKLAYLGTKKVIEKDYTDVFEEWPSIEETEVTFLRTVMTWRVRQIGSDRGIFSFQYHPCDGWLDFDEVKFKSSELDSVEMIRLAYYLSFHCDVAEQFLEYRLFERYLRNYTKGSYPSWGNDRHVGLPSLDFGRRYNYRSRVNFRDIDVLRFQRFLSPVLLNEQPSSNNPEILSETVRAQHKSTKRLIGLTAGREKKNPYLWFERDFSDTYETISIDSILWSEGNHGIVWRGQERRRNSGIEAVIAEGREALDFGSDLYALKHGPEWHEFGIGRGSTHGIQTAWCGPRAGGIGWDEFLKKRIDGFLVSQQRLFDCLPQWLSDSARLSSEAALFEIFSLHPQEIEFLYEEVHFRRVRWMPTALWNRPSGDRYNGPNMGYRFYEPWF